jgi:hypothetical protein
VPASTKNRLLARWGLCGAVAPSQEDQDHFLDAPYAALLDMAETGTSQDVVERLLHMAG